MPGFPVVQEGEEDDIPLMNAPGPTDFDVKDFEQESSCGSSWGRNDDSDDDPEKERLRREPDEEGKYYDDPLWYGKTLADIQYATDLEKANGNAAGRDGDWKRANRYWKKALRGAEKLEDLEQQLRIRLNLVLGYTKRQKTDKALDHCKEALGQKFKEAAPELRSKVYYRQAEAYEAAGEVSKAIASLKMAVEVEPRNSDARKKWQQLKTLQAEQREREKAFFRGNMGKMFGGTSTAEEENKKEAEDQASKQEAKDQETKEEQKETSLPAGSPITEEEKRKVENLTDKSASRKLVERLHGMEEDRPGLPSNVYVGPVVELFGRSRPAKKSTKTDL